MKILITGGNSFTGKYLTETAQQKGLEVFTLTREPHESYEYPLSLLDTNQLIETLRKIKPDCVVHLAAITHVGHGNLDEYYRINTVGTENLLQACRQSGINYKNIILASSSNIYGNQGRAVISEETTPSPPNHYAISKLAMEHTALMWKNELPITITRPFNYSGPGQDPRFLIPKLVTAFKQKDKIITLGNINVERDYSDIRDIISYYMSLIEHSSGKGEVFNLCSGKTISIRNILQALKNISNHDPEIVQSKELMRSNDILHQAGSNKKLTQSGHPEPKYTFKETLEFFYRKI